MNRGAKEKDQEFEAVYNKYFSAIFHYVQRRIVIREEAEDLTAEVFTQVWKHWADYDSERCPIGAWLYIVAANRLKNYYRDRNDSIPFEEEYMQDEPAKDGEIGEAVRLMELRENVKNALESLSERERSIIILKYLKDDSNTQIAKRLGLSDVNVRVISTRALKKMKKYFDESVQ